MQSYRGLFSVSPCFSSLAYLPRFPFKTRTPSHIEPAAKVPSFVAAYYPPESAGLFSDATWLALSPCPRARFKSSWLPPFIDALLLPFFHISLPSGNGVVLLTPPLGKTLFF